MPKPEAMEGVKQQSIQLFSLRRRVQLCIAMLALESFISFEEIFMLAVLQRVNVPTALVSLPGTISSFIGIFIIPLLGWASDRFTFSSCCGQKRPYAFLTLTVSIVGLLILIAVNVDSLYDDSLDGNDDEIRTNSTSVNGLRQIGFSHQTSSPEWSAFNENLSLPFATSLDLMATARTSPSRDNVGQNIVRDAEPNASFLITRTTEKYLQPDRRQNFSASSVRENVSAEAPSRLKMSNYNYTAESAYVTTLGIWGIIGFVLTDHGYDSSTSTFRTYMIAVTPASQHDDIFVVGTLTGAIGGCLTSLLGFVDLSVIFPQGGSVLDSGVAQCLVQACILVILFVTLGTCSLLTGSEQQKSVTQVASLVASYDSVRRVSTEQNGRHPFTESQEQNSETSILSNSTQNEKTQLLQKSASLRDSKNQRKKTFFLCVMTFLGLSANYSYFVYVTNYVGEVIYQGDPNGDVGSDAYGKYVAGVHIASLGMLAFYCLFVIFNLLHRKMLDKIGMKAEYIGASVGCFVMLTTLFLTNHIVVFFVNAASMAIFRSAVYTIPFILANNYSQTGGSSEKNKSESSSSQSGVAMATITAMIPASYLLVSLVMGPLMDVTGNPGAPIIFATASCALGILATFVVEF